MIFYKEGEELSYNLRQGKSQSDGYTLNFIIW